MENVVFDGNDTYNMAFSIADAIIVDMGCGVAVSALPTEKPICCLKRGVYVQPDHPELTDHYYNAGNKDELIEFLNMAKMGLDPKYIDRKKISEEYVMNFDGKNGERIKDFIKTEYNRKRGGHEYCSNS